MVYMVARREGKRKRGCLCIGRGGGVVNPIAQWHIVSTGAREAMRLLCQGSARMRVACGVAATVRARRVHGVEWSRRAPGRGCLWRARPGTEVVLVRAGRP